MLIQKRNRNRSETVRPKINVGRNTEPPRKGSASKVPEFLNKNPSLTSPLGDIEAFDNTPEFKLAVKNSMRHASKFPISKKPKR